MLKNDMMILFNEKKLNNIQKIKNLTYQTKTSLIKTRGVE